MKFILIIGAKSDIAKALAIKYAKEGYDLYLAARNSNSLQKFAKDISIRFDSCVQCLELDILDYQSHQQFYESLEEKPLGIICCVGYLGDQKKAETDFGEVQKIIDTNYTGVVSLLSIVANDFLAKKSGFIVGLGSVAGDRGRASNYCYGSAKSGLEVYLSGLRNRLYKSSVHVLTVKPGFVATQMTQHMKLPKKLTALPEEVAMDIYQAQQKKKDIIYTKWFWFGIMSLIRVIPEFFFKRTDI